MIDRCMTRSEYMRKMIRDLLDMTRIESGQKERELAEIDVVSAARTVAETFLPEASQRQVTITVLADAPVPLLADRGEIEMVLSNLVSNAVKYNRDGGRVEVRVRRDGDHVVLAVSDTGIGMTAEESRRLFGEFVRIKNEKTRHILGSGLGLSIVRKVASLYDGDVTVKSQPDVGSTFTVTLRATPATPA
jgi:signal transduction histidine kinase